MAYSSLVNVELLNKVYTSLKAQIDEKVTKYDANNTSTGDVTNVVQSGSTKLVTSGAIYAMVGDIENLLSVI